MTLFKLLFGLQISMTIIVTPALSESGVVAEFRKEEFLHLHNYLRRSVVPAASNMIRLEWDDWIAAIAKRHAETCSMDHIGYPTLYENLYSGGTNNITTIMMYYFMEREMFDFYNRSKCAFAVCGHYEVITNADMQSFGCAITKTRCNTTNAYHSFCLYRKARMIPWTTHIYAIGKPCSSCPNSHPYCDNGLCVASKAEGRCEKICHHCGILSPDCKCFCQVPFLIAPDCSLKGGSGDEIGECYQCTSDPSSPYCLNDGRMRLTNCSSCNCPSIYTGNRCQYSKWQMRHGVMLAFHWSQIRRGSLTAFYPMNVDQGTRLLNAIRGTIINAILNLCQESIAANDISIAEGFPEIDGSGRLKMVLLVKASPCSSWSKIKNGDYMPQDDLFFILQQVEEQMSDATIASNGTPLEEIAIWE